VKRGDPENPRAELEAMVACFTGNARERIDAAFAGLGRNRDGRNYAFAQELLGGRHAYLGKGIVE